MRCIFRIAFLRPLIWSSALSRYEDTCCTSYGRAVESPSMDAKEIDSTAVAFITGTIYPHLPKNPCQKPISSYFQESQQPERLLTSVYIRTAHEREKGLPKTIGKIRPIQRASKDRTNFSLDNISGPRRKLGPKPKAAPPELLRRSDYYYQWTSGLAEALAAIRDKTKEHPREWRDAQKAFGWLLEGRKGSGPAVDREKKGFLSALAHRDFPRQDAKAQRRFVCDFMAGAHFGLSGAYAHRECQQERRRKFRLNRI